jgi:hypothetical protein
MADTWCSGPAPATPLHSYALVDLIQACAILQKALGVLQNQVDVTGVAQIHLDVAKHGLLADLDSGLPENLVGRQEDLCNHVWQRQA